MHDLKPRRGIHQPQQMSETDNVPYQRKLRSQKYLSRSEKEHHNGSDKELLDDSSEDSPEQHDKQSHLYPELPKEDDTDINKITRLNRQDREEKHPKLQEKSNPSGINNYIILIVIIFAILIAYFCFTHLADNTVSCQTPMCLFQHQYKRLRDTFVNQEKLSWKIIGSAITSVINKTEHTQPAVILLVANNDAKMTSLCIANCLASSVELSYGNSLDYPKIQNNQSASSAAMKETIYAIFKKSFGKENYHVIVLENLDTFSADTAMALHLFCDHENAPYKNIIIILTAIVEDLSEDKKLRPRDMDHIAQNHLNQIWKYELEKEKRAALLSRITASVAVIRTEKNVPTFDANIDNMSTVQRKSKDIQKHERNCLYLKVTVVFINIK